MNPKDRLSNLPDCVLYHILSFVTTEDAVRTSALSTRWKYLFLGLTNIGINSHYLGNHVSVIDFVNRRLMLCEATPVSEFRFKCRCLPEPQLMSSWLTSLLSSRIKVLEVEAPSSGVPRQFPPAATFQSSTLEMLRLCGGGIVFRIPEFVWLPNLKVLNLERLEMQSESNKYRFTHETYPLLEELRLVGICFPFRRNKNADSILKISSDTIKKLAIDVYEHYLSKVDIHTPHLQHLKYKICYVFTPEVQINICKFESLVSAYLAPYSFDECYCEVLSKLRNVKQLYLKWGYLKLDTSLLQFPNLIHLELSEIDVNAMWSVLHRASNLESLVYDMEDYAGATIFPHEDVPQCFAQSLREIRLCNFAHESKNETSCKGEIELARFMLQYGAVLKKMIIQHPRDVTEWLLSLLRDLDRLAPECEIILTVARM